MLTVSKLLRRLMRKRALFKDNSLVNRDYGLEGYRKQTFGSAACKWPPVGSQASFYSNVNRRGAQIAQELALHSLRYKIV